MKKIIPFLFIFTISILFFIFKTELEIRESRYNKMNRWEC